MTAQLPSKERLVELASDFGKPATDIEAAALARFALAAHEQEPVAYKATHLDSFAFGETKSAVEAHADRFGWELEFTEITPLYARPAPSIPAAVPDGYILMPMKLTAENGAKYALSGEFHVLHRVTCHECGGEGCSDCDDDGWLEEKIMIGWDDIKDIYRAAVEACSIKSTGEGV